MRLFRIPYLLAFAICLLFGRSAGSFISRVELLYPQNIDHKSGKTSQSPAFTDQQNFLVVKVDDLEKEEPELDVVWWLLHKDRVPLNLLPVFPTLGNPIQDEIIHQSFGLVRVFHNTKLSPEFEAALHDEGFQWHAYIILDDVALEALTGGGDAFISSTTANPNGEEGSSLDNQWFFRLLTRQWKDMCKQTFEFDWHSKTQSETVDELLKSHLILGPEEDDFFTAWDRILDDNPGLRCVFPTYDSIDLE